ncbi:hypothetical protein [Kaarinaea lacus]
MNEDKDVDKIPSLKALVDQYQDTQAPPGFAERVAAHARDKAAGRWKPMPSRIFAGSSDKDEATTHGWMASPWVIAASFAVVVVSAVLVINVADKPETESQLVQQERAPSEGTVAKITTTPIKNTADERGNEHKAPVSQDAPVAKVTEPPAEKPAQQVTQLAKVEQEQSINPNWDQPVDDNDFTSVAVLWEVSDWLTEETLATPDLTDMPALSDIDALFEKT